MSEEQNQNSETQEFDIHSIFNKKPMGVVEEEIVEKEPKVVVKKAEKKVEPTDDPKEVDDEDDDETTEASKKEDKSGSVDYKSELERLQKTVKDTQRSFHEGQKKLSAYKKAVEKMKENGALLDEEATMLLDHVQFENEPDEDNVVTRYYNIWDKEIEYMRKYGSNPKEIDSQILAFQHLIQSSTAKERQEIFDDLSKYEDDEVEFTKQMLEVGRQYNDEIYSDIHEAGSIRNLKAKYSERENDLQKTIDKLTKQLNKYKSKYEDYDNEPANLRISSGARNIDHNKEATFDIGAIFNKKYQGR